MKKIISFLMAVGMLCALCVPAMAEGEGSSAENPIEVTNGNWEELTASGLAENTYYKLVEDIGSEDAPTDKIFPKGVPSGAHFDGDGYTVWTSVGTVFGENYGEIRNVTVAGSIENNCAAFCNSNYGTVTRCINRADIRYDGDASGFCDKNCGTVSCCENYGDITGSSAAGICTNNGENNNNGIIINCINHGNIEATENRAGGICLNNYRTVLNCVNTASVTGKTSGFGICGGTSSNPSIALCFNCGLPSAKQFTISPGTPKDCWYMKNVNGTACRQITGTNITAVADNFNIEGLLADMNKKAAEYKANPDYSGLDFCEWIEGENGLPTLELCADGTHAWVNGICTRCGNVNNDRHEHIFADGVCACNIYECQITGKHDFTNGDCICGEPAPTSSTLSEGNVWIIAAVAAAAVLAVAAVVITKKKKTSNS